MKKVILGLSFVAALFAVSCNDENDPTPTTPPTPDADSILTGEITASRTLRSNTTYIIDGLVYVKGGATLTIEAGTTIKARPGKTGLIITRGSKIDAVGTSDDPIVFTSERAVPEYGDWGGIVILGNATTNALLDGTAGQGEIEGGVNNDDNDGVYGGNNDADNSGRLKFVRIEWAGYPFQPNQELNSLTMGAVGSQTEIDHVMCAYGFDDAFEFFGGTVNAKHLIAYKTLDDDFDCDFGYRGKIQFAIAIRDKDQADVSGSNGMEQDNDGSGSDNDPYTAPVFSNVTIIGPRETSSTSIDGDFKRAAHLRRNTRTSIFNSILMGYPTGILLDGSKVANNLNSGIMEISNNIIAGSTKSVDTVGTIGTGLDLIGMINDAANTSLTTTAEVELSAPYGMNSAFNPTPSATSPAATGASFNSTKLGGGFFTPTTYRGAADPSGSDQWWKGWTGL